MDALRVARVDNVTLDALVPPSSDDPSATPTKRRLKGTLHLTPHHLIFHPDPSTGSDEIWIPYPIINLLTRLAQTFGGVYPLQIRTRTFESYVLGFDKAMEGGAEDVWQSVKDCALAASVEQLYAFFYSTSNASAPYSARAEFARQGVGSRTKAWRFTDINKDYAFCATYPAKMVVPSRISDSVLVYAGKYRSKGRIPALTYLHSNQASITRSSQPMVGLKNARSPQDEHLIECIFSSHLFDTSAYGSTSTNLIIDARPTANAMANVAMGAGTENMENYKMAKKAYLGIDNIHVMRSSLKTIVQALGDEPIDRSLLRKSNWLRHISTVLDGSLMIIKNVHVNASHVLIHCSDGWDRTAQLSAVAQICLDPFYRTFEGFKTLVEKDWVSFGHKFLDRSGHLSSEKFFTVDQPDDESDEEGGAQRAAQAFFASVQGRFKSDGQKEVSPVFHQFLDCVRQIQRQFPTRFEWNEDYLLDMYYHLYSCQFGTFLFNNERARVGDTRTVPVWAWLEQDQQRQKHRNTEYEPLDDVILYDPRDVKFWHRLFRRGDDEMNGGRVAAPAPGAEVVTVLPGQSDPPANVHGASTAPAARDALAGPSGKGTFRAIDSTSSAFSLQTASNSPVIEASSLSPSSRRADGGLGAIGGGGGSGGWGWSHFSSALQRGAKEIRTIGEGAYNQIRAEIDDGRARTEEGADLGAGAGTGDGAWGVYGGGSGSGSGSGSGAGHGGGAGAWREMQGPTQRPSGRTAVPRLPSEANPWATTSSTSAGGKAGEDNDDGWNTDPWGANSSRTTGTGVAVTVGPTRQADARGQTALGTDALSGARGAETPGASHHPRSALVESLPGSASRSLADLTLRDSYPPSSTPSRTASTAPRSRIDAAGHAGAQAQARVGAVTPEADAGSTGKEQQDKELHDALGGDRRAWDPLGAL